MPKTVIAEFDPDGTPIDIENTKSRLRHEHGDGARFLFVPKGTNDADIPDELRNVPDDNLLSKAAASPFTRHPDSVFFTPKGHELDKIKAQGYSLGSYIRE